METGGRKMQGWGLPAGIALLVLTLALDLFAPAMLPRWADNFRLARAERTLEAQIKEADRLLKTLATDTFGIAEGEEVAANSAGISLYLFIGGELQAWTDNGAAPTLEISCGSGPCLTELGNGLYLQLRRDYSSTETGVALIPVVRQYSFSNQYLQRQFQLSDGDYVVIRDEEAEGHRFSSPAGDYLFTAAAPMEGKRRLAISGWLTVLGALLVFAHLYRASAAALRSGARLRGYVLLGIGLALGIFLWRYWRSPAPLFADTFFSPALYASGKIIGSLGDLIILIGLCLWVGQAALGQGWAGRMKLLQGRWSQTAAVSVAALLIALVSRIIHSLVNDSSIAFDPGNIFSFNQWSIVGYLAVAIVLGVLHFIIQPLSLALRSCSTGDFWRAALGGLGIALGGWYGALALAGSNFSAIEVSLTLLFAFSLLLAQWALRRWKAARGPSPFTVFVGLTTLFTTLSFTFQTAIRDTERQRLLADRLLEQRDPVAEYLFTDIVGKLPTDNIVQTYFGTSIVTQAALKKHLEKNYFGGYLTRYEVDIATFATDGLPLGGNWDRSIEYYVRMINGDGLRSQQGNLFFVNSFGGSAGYVSLITVSGKGSAMGTLVVILREKPFYEQSAYPELLLAEGAENQGLNLQNLSFAIYEKGRLVTLRGDFRYPGRYLADYSPSQRYHPFAEDGYRHVAYAPSPSLTIVVSLPAHKLVNYVAALVFILLTLVIPLGGLIWARSWSAQHRQSGMLLPGPLLQWWQHLSYRFKIIYTIIGIMSVALLGLGWATIQYISAQYEDSEIASLRDNTRIAATRLETALDRNPTRFRQVPGELETLLKDLSTIYQSDINLFDAKGRLLGSSQPLIYESGIVAGLMNPEALNELKSGAAAALVTEESIGRLTYTASYQPLRDMQGRIIGFLNLPYFSKEETLRNRIASFLLTLINIYLLVALGLVGVGYFIANGLTAPLNLIRNHLRGAGLGKRNDPIQWENDDEIGKLIQEYNAMLAELENSARQLARNERELAWREMARQVAHEIKNPLTPMKLKVQFLQQAYESGDPRLGQIIQSTTALVIQQIESLAGIATAFSGFAAMPESKPELFDARGILEHICELYAHERSEVVATPSPAPLWVFADRDGLERAIGNLVKNGLQAIPEGREGRVEMRGWAEGEECIITITDNGTGIAPEAQDKIFVPNFSTKSSGMGLGLAIVRHMVERAGGTIKFDTVPDRGTTFTIRLPLRRN